MEVMGVEGGRVAAGREGRNGGGRTVRGRKSGRSAIECKDWEDWESCMGNWGNWEAREVAGALQLYYFLPFDVTEKLQID